MNEELFKQTIVHRMGFPIAPTCIRYNPLQYLVVFASKDGSLYLLREEKFQTYLVVENGNISDMIFFKNSSHLVCVSNQETICLVDYADLSVISKIKLKNEKLMTTSLSKDDRILFCGTSKGNVYLIKTNVDALSITKYAIFWNVSCRGHAHTHPGSVIFMHTCSFNKILYIVFSRGIISVWNMEEKNPDKVVNLHETVYSCNMTDPNTLVFGCANSAILLFSLSTCSFERKRLFDGYSMSGCVWKIESTFNVGIEDSASTFLCCGGHSQLEDDGAGVCAYVGKKFVTLTHDVPVDASFYQQTNQLTVIVLFSDHISVFSLQNNNSLTIANVTDLNSMMNITHVSPIVLKQLPPDTSQNIVKIAENLHPDCFGANIDAINPLVIFISFEKIILKCYIATISCIFCIADNSLPKDENILSMEFLMNKCSLLVRCHSKIYLYRLTSGKPVESQHIIFNCDNTFRQESISVEAPNNILQLECLISLEADINTLICQEIHDKNLIISFNEALHIVFDGYRNVQTISTKSLLNDNKSKMFSNKSKRQKIFKSRLKIKETNISLKDPCFLFIYSLKLNYENQILDVFFCHERQGPFLSLAFNNTLTCYAIDYLCVIKSKILGMACHKPLPTDDNRPASFIVISTSCLFIYDGYFDGAEEIFPVKESIFTENFLIINDDLLTYMSDQKISCYSLSKRSMKFQVKILPDGLNWVRIVPSTTDLALVAAGISELLWISFTPQLSNILASHNYNTGTSFVSYFNPLSYLYSFFEPKPIDLEIIVSSAKDIVPETIADSFGRSKIESELLIKADERKEKLTKVVEDAERLKNTASAFNQTASLILEKVKKGQL